VPFSHDACGCWKQLIRRLLPEGTKGWGRIERYVSQSCFGSGCKYGCHG
jgi:hypothetical protein